MATQRPARKIWWGYYDMGAIQIPPNPKYFVLTDRVTAQLWWVSLNPNTNLLVISTTLPANSYIDGASNGGQTVPKPKAYNNLVIYEAFDEPIIGFIDDTNFARLTVINGVLGVSLDKLNKQRGQAVIAPPLIMLPNTAILGYGSKYATVVLNPSSPTTLTITINTLTQTPNPSPVQTYD